MRAPCGTSLAGAFGEFHPSETGLNDGQLEWDEQVVRCLIRHDSRTKESEVLFQGAIRSIPLVLDKLCQIRQNERAPDVVEVDHQRIVVSENPVFGFGIFEQARPATRSQELQCCV